MKQIKRALEIAKNYRDYGINLEFKESWTTLRGTYRAIIDSEEPEIKIYFANDYDTCSVEFGRIKVSLFTNEITLPTTITSDKFKSILDDAETFLINDLKEHSDVVLESVRTERAKEIKDMEEAIERMKKQNS